MKEIKTTDWPALLQAVAQLMAQHEQQLCEMDARMGDGDLGLTMKKGYCAMPELYAQVDEADMGKRLTKTGLKLSSLVPSTMGTLMASGWMDAGKRLAGKTALSADGFAEFLQGFADGIAKRGKCAPGECTVLDAILPAAQAAAQAAQAGQNLAEAAQAAFQGAQQGVEATKQMIPKYGKAAVFAGRASGQEDQGAVAGMLLIQGLNNAIQAAQ